MFEGMTLVTTSAVREELLNGVADHPALRTVLDAEWLLTAATDGIQVLLAFVAYRKIFGGGTRDVGEATVLAYAEVHAATAVIDDQVGVKHGKARGVTVVRTLSRIAECVEQGRFDLAHASVLLQALTTLGGARFPCDHLTFAAWFQQNRLP